MAMYQEALVMRIAIVMKINHDSLIFQHFMRKEVESGRQSPIKHVIKLLMWVPKLQTLKQPR